MSTLADMGLKVLVSLFFLFTLWFLIVFALTSLVSLVFPMVFDIVQMYT